MKFSKDRLVLPAILFLSLFSLPRVFSQSVGISSTAITPDASSILEIRSATKGLLIPRMSTTDRNNISTPATGLILYNTTTNKFNFYNGSSWTEFSSGSSAINSITGTSNRISIGGTATDPVIDIASTYVGQNSITTLGTITTGTWNGTVVGVAYGGTGLNSYSTGDLIYASDATTLSKLTAGSTGQVLRSNGVAAPSWTEGGTMMFSGASNNTSVNNTTLYFPVNEGGVAGASTDVQAGLRTLVSRDGVIKNLYIKLSASLAGGKTGTVTIMKNGVATALDVVLSVGPVNFNNTIDAITVAAGDELGVRVTTTGNVKFSWSAEYTYQ
jgi:hypothetical protein